MGEHPAPVTIERAATRRQVEVVTWICGAVGVVTIVNVMGSSSFDEPGRGPFLGYAAMWLWAAYRLYRRGRSGLARGLSIVSLSLAAAVLVGSSLALIAWSDLDTVRVSAAGVVQVVVPVVGALGVLVALRGRRT